MNKQAPTKTAERLDLESRGRTAAEKRKLLRNEDERMRESEMRKDRTRHNPKYAQIDERLKWEGHYNFWLRLLLGSLFFSLIFWLMYEMYAKLDVLLQIGYCVTYSLVASALAIFLSFILVKRRAFKKDGDKIKYRDLHKSSTWRSAAYESISILLNACMTVFGLIAVIKTLPLELFLITYIITKIAARGIAWLIARYANHRGFLVIGIVAIAFVLVLFVMTPFWTILSIGGE